MYLPHPFAEALARPRQWGQGGGGGRASIGSASVWEEDGWSQQGMSKSKQTHSNSHAPSSRGSVVFVSVPFPIPPHRHRPLPSCTHAQPHAGDDLLPGSGPGSVHGSVSSRGGPSLFTGGPSVNTSVGYVRGTGLTPVHGNNLAAPPNRYPQSADLSQFDGWGFLETSTPTLASPAKSSISTAATAATTSPSAVQQHSPAPRLSLPRIPSASLSKSGASTPRAPPVPLPVTAAQPPVEPVCTQCADHGPASSSKPKRGPWFVMRVIVGTILCFCVLSFVVEQGVCVRSFSPPH